ncbi:MAG: DMT family transporter [Pseudomonadota bacterium]
MHRDTDQPPAGRRLPAGSNPGGMQDGIEGALQHGTHAGLPGDARPADAPWGASPARPGPLLLWCGLFGVGLSWGITQIFMKGAMAGGFHPICAALWQAMVGAIVTTVALRIVGRSMPHTRYHLVFYVVCGLLGTALPASLSFAAIVHLPVGVQALMLSTVPLMTVALALPMGREGADLRRIGGIALGFTGMLAIILPEAGLPGARKMWWMLLPALAALSYAGENVVIDRFRPPSVDTLQIGCGLLWSASIILLLPVIALGLPMWPTGEASAAWTALTNLLAVTGFNIAAYLGFVWLIGQAGPIFASQVGYIVTGTGVVTGMLFLGESHAWTVWVAMGLLFAGIALVTPRRHPA